MRSIRHRGFGLQEEKASVLAPSSVNFNLVTTNHLLIASLRRIAPRVLWSRPLLFCGIGHLYPSWFYSSNPIPTGLPAVRSLPPRAVDFSHKSGSFAGLSSSVEPDSSREVQEATSGIFCQDGRGDMGLPRDRIVDGLKCTVSTCCMQLEATRWNLTKDCDATRGDNTAWRDF